MSEGKLGKFGWRTSWGYKDGKAWKEVETSSGLEIWVWDFKTKKFRHTFLDRDDIMKTRVNMNE